jgi:hypothetical protein
MSSEEEGTIGFRPAASGGLKGVVFKNSSKDPARAATIGARFRTAAVTAAPAPAPVPVKAVRQITMAAAPKKMELAPVAPAPVAVAVEGAKKTVRFAEEAAGGAGEEAVPAPAPIDKATILASATVDTTSLVTPAATLALKKQVKGIDVSRVGPPPADSPMVTKDSFKDAVMPVLTMLKETKPVDLAPEATAKIEAGGGGTLAEGPIYTPITSPEFPYFMIQTYQQYSKALSSLVTDAATGKPVIAAKEIDKEACKKFDPNKVENFYYQKLVRDYMSNGTPYRGNLLYHGLGSGKTCTSIAAAEALYWGGRRKIYVMTPATLSNNYRRELAKCGYFPLRRSNLWTFLPVPAGDKGRNWIILTEMIGLPGELVEKQGGGWFPNPKAPSNWERLTPAQQESIRQQQTVHMNARFRFIHYNGVSPATLAQLAEVGLKDRSFEFDDAVIIIDEVHNLVRTINGTRLGGHSVAEIMESGIEPREFLWSMPLRRERPGYRYPRGYTLYRLLQGAVNSKVICMSATPMINYAQELAVLVNILGGEQRVVEIPLTGLRKDLTAEERAAIQTENEAARERAAKIAEMESRRAGKAVAAQPARTLAADVAAAIELWAKYHPEIDFFAIEEAADRTPVLRVTPVPHGFAKVADSDYPLRGFVRMKNAFVEPAAKSRERNMDLWGASLVEEMEKRAFLTKAGAGTEALEAVRAARAAGVGTMPTTKLFRCATFPMLPENGDIFVPNFVDRATLKIMNREVLIARCSGLVSYYKGGSEELMPRMSRNEVVEVPMSDFMFKEYTRARMKEMEMEGELPAADGDAAAAGKKRKGATAAEQDLYAQATKSQSAGFKSLTRAACNWVFPEEIPRPVFSKDDQLRALGLDKREQLLAADLAEDTDVEQAPMAAVAVAVAGATSGGGGATTDGGAAEEVGPAVLADEPGVVGPEVDAPMDTSLASKITTALAALEAKADTYLDTEIATFSPKYAAILANIRESPGPVLVYSQFKTLEGLGIFAAALRASPEAYLPLDIVIGSDGQWTIPEEFMEAGANRYILYTGDQALDKRRLLLQLYNADVAGLPPKLSAQCAALLAGAPDNRDGRVARVFMITQSGAEGISLFNTRQVHIMEPYWNNVRLQQVIGRAIRTCSHMNLPWEDREVAVFTYLSVFTDKQKAEGARQVIMADKGMTTDQTIFDIATKKQKLADELAAILQEAAIDCDLHHYENGITGHCFRFSKGSRPNFLWHPDWKRDLQLASMVRKT